MPISLSGVSCFVPPFHRSAGRETCRTFWARGFHSFCGKCEEFGSLGRRTMGALAATGAKKEGVLGKDEHCSAGRQCQLPPSLLCPPRSPSRVTSFAQEDQGTGTRKSEGDAVADAATAFEVKGPRMEGTGRKRRLFQHTYTFCFLRLIASFYCNFLGLIRIIFNPIPYAWRLFLATTTHII